jgi:hypothetical protein
MHLKEYWRAWHLEDYAAQTEFDRDRINKRKVERRKKQRHSKCCIVCGINFYAKGNDHTCSETCSIILKSSVNRRWKDKNREHVKDYEGRQWEYQREVLSDIEPELAKAGIFLKGGIGEKYAFLREKGLCLSMEKAETC